MNTTMSYLFVCVVIILMGLTACTSSHGTEEGITGIGGVQTAINSSTTETSSAEFTLTASSTETYVDLNAENSSTEEDLVIDVFTPNQMDITSPLTIVTPTEDQLSDPMKVNPLYTAYKNLPSTMSYNGSSSITYSFEGSSYTVSLDSQQQMMLEELRLELEEAEIFGGSGGPSLMSSSNTNEANLLPTKPIEEMSEQEVKKFLEDKGYKVKKLGNKRFAVTREYPGHDLDDFMTITSIFDANLVKMEPGYAVGKNGKELSQHLSKQDKNNGNRHSKGMMKRTMGDHLLLDITYKNNKN